MRPPRSSATASRMRLAIIDDDGNVIVAGDDVAREAEAVALNNYRNTLKGQGYLRTYSAPLNTP